MKPGLLLALSTLWAAQVLAQSDVAGTVSDAGAERSRIEEARTTEMAALASEEAACYQRFAVNDCLKKVQSRRRVLDAALKRREALLHDAERRQQATDEAQRLAQKAQEKQQQDAEVAARHDATRQAELLQAQQEKQAAHAARAVSAPQAAASHAASGLTPAEQAASRDSYAAKQAAAEKKRQEIARRLADKKAVKPLPALPVAP